MQGKQSVDKPEINAALDLLQVHLPRMRQQIEAFRVALNLHMVPMGWKSSSAN